MSKFNFIETDSEKLTNDLINHFETYTRDTLPVGDERRQFLQGLAYVFSVMINDINVTGNQNLLRYSYGNALDDLAVLLGVERLKAEPATVTLKFTLSDAQATDVTIPKGTRATADGNIFFATDEDLIIVSGATSGTVTATATVAGLAGNGFVEGQIAIVVDGVAYVESVVNTTTSINGRDIETDDELRERVRLAPFSFSTAGAEQAYKYLALSANVNVGDAQAYRTSAGCVTVAIVKKDGTLPTSDDEILTDVANACSAKTKRPLTDNVTIAAATAVETEINVEYFINVDDSATTAQIQADVENAVAEYKLWQTTKIGRDINPDRLRKLMLNAGADKVTITSPTETTVGDGEVAQITNVTVNYGGLTE